MTLVEKMFELAPNKNPVFTAISHLDTEDDIRTFQREYQEYMIKEGYSKMVADSNIGYILGYYDESIRTKWTHAISVTHPVFRNHLKGYNSSSTKEEN